MSKSILIFCLFILSGTCLAQKVLMLEKAGSLKTEKILVGDELVYALKTYKKEWIEEYIVDIDIAGGRILFQHHAVPIEDIYGIRLKSGGGFARTVSTLLTTFSYSWGFWTLVSAAFGDSISGTTLGIGLGSFAIGQFLKLFYVKTYKLKGRRRIRLVDLTFYETQPVRT